MVGRSCDVAKTKEYNANGGCQKSEGMIISLMLFSARRLACEPMRRIARRNRPAFGT